MISAIVLHTYAFLVCGEFDARAQSKIYTRSCHFSNNRGDDRSILLDGANMYFLEVFVDIRSSSILNQGVELESCL